MPADGGQGGNKATARTPALAHGVWVLAVLTWLSLSWLVTALPAVLSQGKAQLIVDSVTIGEGLTGAVSVVVRDVRDLYAADVQLAFDPAVVEVLDADPATPDVQIQPGDFLDLGFVVRNVADNSQGTVWFALTQLHPSTPKTGQGVLFSVVFRGRRLASESTVAIVAATLATRFGEEIPATLVDGGVRVVSRMQAPATPTPAPLVRPILLLPTSAATPTAAFKIEPATAVPATEGPSPDTERPEAATPSPSAAARRASGARAGPATPELSVVASRAPTAEGEETTPPFASANTPIAPAAAPDVTATTWEPSRLPPTTSPAPPERGREPRNKWLWVAAMVALVVAAFALGRKWRGRQ